MEQLPIVEVKGLILKKGEVCHFICEAYYKYHEYRLNSWFEEGGKLYITNKRIIFLGSNKTHTYQNSTILKYEVKFGTPDYTLYVYKENQSKLQPFCISPDSAKEIKEILSQLFN